MAALAVGAAVLLGIGVLLIMNSGLVRAPWVETMAEIAQRKGPEPVETLTPPGGAVIPGDAIVKVYGRRVSFMFEATYEMHDPYGAAWSIALDNPIYVRPSQFGATELVNVQANVPTDGGKRLSTLNWYVVLDGPLRGSIYLKDVSASADTKHVVYSAYRACPESKWLNLDKDPKPVRQTLLRAPDVVCERASKMVLGK